VQAQGFRANIRQVARRSEGCLHLRSGLNAGIPKRFGREFYEPIIVHIDRLRNVRFPTLRLVEIDGHSLSLLPAVRRTA